MPAKVYTVSLSEAQKRELEHVIAKGTTALAIRRAYILLLCDRGWSDQRISRALGCHRNTVANVRIEFGRRGIEALSRKTRTNPPVPRKLDDFALFVLRQLRCRYPAWGNARLARKLAEIGLVTSVSQETVRIRLTEC